MRSDAEILALGDDDAMSDLEHARCSLLIALRLVCGEPARSYINEALVTLYRIERDSPRGT